MEGNKFIRVKPSQMELHVKWQPTPVFLPGESQGRWSLVGCRLWGRTESDTTEVTAANLMFSRKNTSFLVLTTESSSSCWLACGRVLSPCVA